MSLDDRKALSLVEESITEKDGHLEIGMPWRVESSEIPNNRNTAEKRLGYLKKKLQADAPLKEKYSAAIQEYLDSGARTKRCTRTLTRCLVHTSPRSHQPEQGKTPCRV